MSEAGLSLRLEGSNAVLWLTLTGVLLEGLGNCGVVEFEEKRDNKRVILMASEQVMALPFSVELVVEDVIRQHGGRLSDRDLASRKAEEACTNSCSLLAPVYCSCCRDVTI